MASPNSDITQADIERAAYVVEHTFDPETGRHPEEIFHAINATAVRSVVELIILDPVKDTILLTKRDSDDPYYADTWHLPGVIEVRTDIDRGNHPSADDNAALRVKEELGGTQITSLVPLSPEWLKQEPRISKRGGEAAVFYGAYILDAQPKEGQMFDIDDLPEPIHEHHPEVIAKAPMAVSLATASLMTRLAL